MAIVESGGVQRIDGSKDLSAQLRSVNGEISVLDEKLSKLRTERNALEKRAKHLRQLITDSRLKPSKFAQTCMSHDWSGPQGKFFCDRALFAGLQLFGHSSFRGLQLEAMRALLHRHDALVIMPTGFGKSLLYMLPAVLLEGVVVVISPLLSLINDQILALERVGVDVASVTSETSAAEDRNVYARMSACSAGPRGTKGGGGGEGSLKPPKLLYLTPEKLSKSAKACRAIASAAAGGCLSAVVVDEAHCVSEWGADFRPDYRSLRSLRGDVHGVTGGAPVGVGDGGDVDVESVEDGGTSAWLRGVPFLAVTATATTRVRADIVATLGLGICQTAVQPLFSKDWVEGVARGGGVAVAAEGALVGADTGVVRSVAGGSAVRCVVLEDSEDGGEGEWADALVKAEAQPIAKKEREPSSPPSSVGGDPWDVDVEGYDGVRDAKPISAAAAAHSKISPVQRGGLQRDAALTPAEIMMQRTAARCVQKDCEVFVHSFDRPNLAFWVALKPSSADDVASLVGRVVDPQRRVVFSSWGGRGRDGEGGRKIHSRGVGMQGRAIVYAFSKRDAEVVAEALKGKGVRAMWYHAGLTGASRAQVAQSWRDGKVDVVVATVAFGMGIDFPHVRVVVHHSAPKSLSGLYQEAGRAGRDGIPAECVVLLDCSELWRLVAHAVSDAYHLIRPPPVAALLRSTSTADTDSVAGFMSSSVPILYAGHPKFAAQAEAVAAWALGGACRRAVLLQHFDEPVGAPRAVAVAPPYCCDICEARHRRARGVASSLPSTGGTDRESEVEFDMVRTAMLVVRCLRAASVGGVTFSQIASAVARSGTLRKEFRQVVAQSYAAVEEDSDLQQRRSKGGGGRRLGGGKPLGRGGRGRGSGGGGGGGGGGGVVDVGAALPQKRPRRVRGGGGAAGAAGTVEVDDGGSLAGSGDSELSDTVAVTHDGVASAKPSLAERDVFIYSKSEEDQKRILAAAEVAVLRLFFGGLLGARLNPAVTATSLAYLALPPSPHALTPVALEVADAAAQAALSAGEGGDCATAAEPCLCCGSGLCLSKSVCRAAAQFTVTVAVPPGATAPSQALPVGGGDRLSVVTMSTEAANAFPTIRAALLAHMVESAAASKAVVMMPISLPKGDVARLE